MKEKTLGYRFTIEHIDGKKNIVTDTLSRYPVSTPDSDDKELANELYICSSYTVSACVEDMGVDIQKLKDIAASDLEYQTLLHKVVNDDFAVNRRDEDPIVKQYHGVRDRLSVVDGVLMYSFEDGHTRIVVPQKQRASVLNTFHAAHQGEKGILRRARQTVYWPGLDNDVQRTCAGCKECIENAPSNTKEELIVSPVPEYPFQDVSSDLFSLDGHHYLIYVDRLTAWVELAYFNKDPASSDIISKFRDYFHHSGVPMELSFDGGPNISSAEMDAFYTKWGIKQRQSSAYYPQSNGRAEAAVKSMKKAIRGNIGPNGSLNSDKVTAALLQYRNTPLRNVGLSPAQLLLGRSLRDAIPQPTSAYHVSPEWEANIRQRERAIAQEQLKSKEYHDRQPTRTYNELTVGQSVACQNVKNRKWDRTGIIKEVMDHRQYKVVLNGSGRISLRNRIHLKPLLHVKSPLSIRGHVDEPPTPNPVHPADPPQDEQQQQQQQQPQPQPQQQQPQRPQQQQHPPRHSPRRSGRSRRKPIRYGEWMV